MHPRTTTYLMSTWISCPRIQFFEPDAPEDNHIPNVNLDLMSTHPVLYSAPKSGVDPRIKTSGLRVLDQVLSHMDNEAYDMKNYSVLERVAHIMHMREMYANVQPIYQALKDKPPPNPEVICHCINDIESNGVKDTLYFIALKIREPNVMTNIVLRIDGNHAYMYDGKDLSAESDNRHSFSIKYRLFRRPRRPAEPGTKYKFKSKYKYQSHRRRRRSLLFVNPDSIVDNPDKYEDEMPALVSEKAWKFWKEQSLDTDEQMNYDIAMFLYCTLNH